MQFKATSIFRLTNSTKIANIKNVNQFKIKPYIKEALEKLQHDLLVTPIDRAVNNVSSLYKRFYTTTLLKEFGVTGTSIKTYK